jgi:hypothetical protein
MDALSLKGSCNLPIGNDILSVGSRVKQVENEEDQSIVWAAGLPNHFMVPNVPNVSVRARLCVRRDSVISEGGGICALLCTVLRESDEQWYDIFVVCTD